MRGRHKDVVKNEWHLLEQHRVRSLHPSDPDVEITEGGNVFIFTTQVHWDDDCLFKENEMVNMVIG